MKIIISIFIIIAAVLFIYPALIFAENSSIPARVTPAPQKVDSYELFWPMVAGQVMGEQLYSLKVLKEQIREFFIFGSFQKAGFNINLSEKRLLEAEKLYVIKKDYSNAVKSLETSKLKIQKALDSIKKDEKDSNFNSLKELTQKSLEKQILLLKALLEKIPADQKQIVQEQINFLNSIPNKL